MYDKFKFKIKNIFLLPIITPYNVGSVLHAEAVQYCGGQHQYKWRIASVHVGDSINTVEIVQCPAVLNSLRSTGPTLYEVIIFSIGEEPVKLSTEVPRQRFWLTFTFFVETIIRLIIKIALIQTKISLLLDLNQIFNNNQTPVAM